jgi:hypothetical protein
VGASSVGAAYWGKYPDVRGTLFKPGQGIFVFVLAPRPSDVAPTELAAILLWHSYKDFAPTERSRVVW